MLPLDKINKEWTLFVDRDGVINHEKDGDYIHTWEEFRFYEGVKEAFEIFDKKFRRIIVVTNQRGIGRGLTKEEDVHTIHNNMTIEIVKQKGRVDKVYFCADTDSSSPLRKPNPGMGLQAATDFPDIDLSKALMVGNRKSDMEFGRNLGIYTVYLTTTHPAQANEMQADAIYDSLHAFAKALL